jgi:hypothetical protein
MQVLFRVAGVRGEDLFSFQPIGRAKVPCFFYFKVSGGGGGRMEDFFFGFSLFPNVFPQCSI